MNIFGKWLKTRQALWAAILILSFVVIAMIYALADSIYRKDEPAIIPHEIRQDIRGAIKESVAEPIARIAPSLGRPIVDSVYVAPKTGQSTPTASNDSTVPDPTAGWNVYKDERLGFEIKYPDGYRVDNEGDITEIVKIENTDAGLWFYGSNSGNEPLSWWLQEKKKYTASFDEENMRVNGVDIIKASTSEGMAEVHYILKINNIIVDILAIGGATNEEIISTIKVQSI